MEVGAHPLINKPPPGTEEVPVSDPYVMRDPGLNSTPQSTLIPLGTNQQYLQYLHIISYPLSFTLSFIIQECRGLPYIESSTQRLSPHILIQYTVRMNINKVLPRHTSTEVSKISFHFYSESVYRSHNPISPYANVTFVIMPRTCIACARALVPILYLRLCV